jgi:hypothetical protein
VSDHRSSTTVYKIPMSHSKWFLFRGDFPVTQEEWDRLMVLLDLFRPGLVEEEIAGPEPHRPEGFPAHFQPHRNEETHG